MFFLLIFVVPFLAILGGLVQFARKGYREDIQRGIIISASWWKRILLIISIAVLALWISDFLSTRELPNEPLVFNIFTKSDEVVSGSGFPLVAFKYPVCVPCGGDYIPKESWPPFFANFILWLLIVFLISFKFPLWMYKERFVYPLLLFAGFSSIVSYFLLLLAYD